MPADYPNVVFILCDQMKATASHLYGNPDCRTPALERLAETGVKFEHAFCPHPLCVPSRVSMMTGLYSGTHGSRRNETWLGPEQDHLFRMWKERGYRTGLIGKNHCFPLDRAQSDFDVWCEIGHYGLLDDHTPWGMEWFRDPAGVADAHRTRQTMPQQSPRIEYAVTDYPVPDYSTGLIAGQTVRFINEHRDTPFALWVSFPDPHTPYEAPRHYADRFPPLDLRLPPRSAREFGEHATERNRVLHRILGIEEDPEIHVRSLIATYYAMITFIDDAVGQIVATLEKHGLREKTIIIFTTDHGDLSGEHGMINKGGLFYDCLTRVPLIFSWPGVIPRYRVDRSMVNLVDIAPTLLCLQGDERYSRMEGLPLPTVTTAPERDTVFAEYGDGGPPFRISDLEKMVTQTGRAALMESLQWREAEGKRKMIRTTRWKYVHDPMGDLDELYDLHADPWELTNIAHIEEHAAVVEALRQRLNDWTARDSRR